MEVKDGGRFYSDGRRKANAANIDLDSDNSE